MNKFFLTVFLFLAWPSWTFSQVTGGQEAFNFLRLPTNPQLTALGSINVSHPGNNVGLAWQNPSLLRPYLHNQLALSYNSYYAGINLLNLQYAYHSPKLATTFGGGIQYVNYGKFVETDQFGNSFGDFTARDLAFNLMASRKYLERWRYGLGLKYASSNIYNNKASALLSDIGISYMDSANLLTVGLVATNVGVMLKGYDGNALGKEPMPFDVRLGISKRFAHLPLRVMATVHHLHKWDIRYNNPADITTSNLLGTVDSTASTKSYFADKLFRHFILAAEINLGKRIDVTVGYNHQRRGELAIKEKTALAGFSFGASIHLNKFQVQYARSHYHLAGAYNEFGLNFHLNKLMAFGKGKARENWKADYGMWD